MIDNIEDENVLNQLMEDVSFYASKEDVIDNLTSEQLKELNAAVEEADKNETLSWNDFKKEMNEWTKK